MAKITLRLVGNDRVVFHKQMLTGETREFSPRQAEAMLASDPGSFERVGPAVTVFEAVMPAEEMLDLVEDPAPALEDERLEIAEAAKEVDDAQELRLPEAEEIPTKALEEEVKDEHKPDGSDQPAKGRRPSAKQRSK